MSNKKNYSRRDFLKLSAAAGAGALAAVPASRAWAGSNPIAGLRRKLQTQELIVWADRGEPQASILNTFVDMYNEKLAADGSGVTLKFENIHPGIEERLAAVAAARDGYPDIVLANSGESYLPQYITGGLIPALNPVLDEIGFAWDDLLPGMQRKIDGQNHWMIYSASAFLQFINLDHAAAAGLDIESNPPDSTESMLEWADAMTERDANGNVTRSGFLLTGSGGHPGAVWGNRLQSLGGSVLTDDGAGTNFNNDMGLEAIDWLMNCFDEWNISDINMTDRYNQWLTGNASIFWSGNWVIASSLQQEGLNFATWKMPSWQGGRASRATGEAMFMMDTGDQDRMMASGEFLKWFTEHLGEYNAEAGDICPTKSGSELDVYVNRPSAPFAEPVHQAYDEGFAYYTNFHPDGNVFNYYFGEVVTRNLDNVWQGLQEPQEALDRMQEEVQEILDDRPALAYTIE